MDTSDWISLGGVFLGFPGCLAVLGLWLRNYIWNVVGQPLEQATMAAQNAQKTADNNAKRIDFIYTRLGEYNA